jgi:hypothetical protein
MVLIAAAMMASVLAGCSREATAPAVQEEKPAVAPATAAPGVTELPTTQIGPYAVTANYEGPLTDGHFNLHVTGPEFAAIRQWVGPEDAAGVMVSRAEVLPDHIHAGVEMPTPLPADPRLWIEIEGANGTRVKGSIALK